ncbi:MAG: hypothetical protein RL154_1524 [Pseudomonadota bacterium]|jgi:homoserine kinase type II
MGIVKKISFLQLARHLKYSYNLCLKKAVPTKNGVSDTTYILYTAKNKKFVLKVFESASLKQINQEMALLKELKSSLVAVPIGKPRLITGKLSLLYPFLNGLHPDKINILQTASIGLFLANLHNKNLKTKPPIKAINAQCLDILKNIDFTPFAKYGNLLEQLVKTPVDGVIHGDLFFDNALFCSNKLCGVLDFSEATKGSFAFDIGTAAFGFCFEGNILNFDKLNSMLNTYNVAIKNKPITKSVALQNIRYAAIYFGVFRFWRKGNFFECLQRLDAISHCAEYSPDLQSSF